MFTISAKDLELWGVVSEGPYKVEAFMTEYVTTLMSLLLSFPDNRRSRFCFFGKKKLLETNCRCGRYPYSDV